MVTSSARRTPMARRRGSRQSHLRSPRLKRLASQKISGVSAAQRYASNRVRRMGPDVTWRSEARGSVSRLAVTRTARNVQNRAMSASSRARKPRLGAESALSGLALTVSLASRLP
jgi:hypothetical protein